MCLYSLWPRGPPPSPRQSSGSAIGAYCLVVAVIALGLVARFLSVAWSSRSAELPYV